MTNLPDSNRSNLAAERSRLISKTLADAARRARFSTRSRRTFSADDFRARKGINWFGLLIRLAFVVFVLVPSAAAVGYYGFFASDQYVAEAQFTVAGREITAPDGVTPVAGIAGAAIVQNTQIVVSYIHSRSAVEALQEKVGLRERYARQDVDIVARLQPDRTIEQFVKYWSRMSHAAISMPGGIVKLEVRAFSPEDAKTIADSLLQICEDLINGLNGRMLRDAVDNREEDLLKASERLGKILSALEAARNVEGTLDAEKSADYLNKLLVELRAQHEKLNIDYSVLSKTLSGRAPSLVNLKARIDAGAEQINELENKLTSGTEGDNATLSSAMTRMARLDLEKQVAEKLYAGAATSLEISKLIAEQQLMYLNIFVKPEEPVKGVYPRRILNTAAIILASLALWGAFFGLLTLARKHMA